MTDSPDTEPTDDDSTDPGGWQVLGYTDTGAEIARDRDGRRWITQPLIPPDTGTVSFSDSDLDAFLHDPLGYDTAPDAGDPRESRRWTLEQLGVYLSTTVEQTTQLCQLAQVDPTSIQRDEVNAVLRLGWVESYGPALFAEDITASIADHVWATPEVAKRLLELDSAVFDDLVARGTTGQGFPCAVMVDLPEVGWRVDVTETRSALALTGDTLRRVLAGSDASERLAILQSLGR